jgi:hypothetical protein
LYGLALLAAASTAGCQLPLRAPLPPLDQAPNLDVKIAMPAANGIFPPDLSKIPGSVCFPNAQGLCDAAHTYPIQFLKPGAKVTVTPGSDPGPGYDGLIDSKYTLSKNMPFVAPARFPDQLNEFKTYVVAKATIVPGPGDADANGFPGAQAIVKGLRDSHGITVKAGATIYWLTGAELLTVTEDDYTKVPDSAEVTGVGFADADATYNAGEPTRQATWIGLQAVKMTLVLATGSTDLAATTPEPATGQIFDIDDSGKFKPTAGK